MNTIDGFNLESLFEKNHKMKKILKWLGISVGALFVIGVIADMNKSPEEKAAAGAVTAAQAAQKQEDAQAQQAQALAKLPSVTAIQLAREYDENTVAADQKFKSKQFKVSGRVANINTDIMGTPYVTMGGTNEFMEPQFSFDESVSDQLAKIRKGMKLTLACEGAGDIAKIPMSKDCRILQ
ncbi:MAG: hypothetical protein WAN92_05160 [Herbaspirillum sp.]